MATERFERRLRLLVRLGLFGVLIGLLLILAFRQRSPSVGPRQVTHWSGSTSQQLVVQATTVNGALWSLHARVQETCSDASPWTLDWNLGQQRFKQRDGHVSGGLAATAVRSNTGESVVVAMSVEAKVGDRLTGTVAATAVRSTTAGAIACRASAVQFVLRPGR